MRVCPKSKNLAFLVDVFPQTFYHEGFFYAEKMNTQEQWKPVAECNGEYYVSSWGRVKSFKFGKERILKPSLIGNGYPAINIWQKTKKSKCITIHKLVALAFIPKPDNKTQVNHKDGNKLNNHIDNLEWVTSQENNQHAWDNGLCENKRLAIASANRKAQSKPVVDIVTGNKYDSLKLACQDIDDSYNKHLLRIFQKSKLQRFFYL
jgi:hypothetical protein